MSAATGVRVASLGECMIEVSASRAGGEARVGFGGDTLNTAVYLARAGSPSVVVSFVTVVGEDPFSDNMVAEWQREGLECSLVFRDHRKLPGLYMIATDERGERSFYYWREQAAARELLTPERTSVLAETLREYALVYLSGITLAILDASARSRLLATVRRLRESGTMIAFDSNYRPRLWPDRQAARAAVSALAPLTDIALLSASDEMALFGDESARAVVRRWRRYGDNKVIVTDGSGPALAAHGEGIEEILPQAVVADPVDTTAAGDAFNGGFLAAYLQGEGMSAAVRAGHQLAARVVSYPGAITPA